MPLKLGGLQICRRAHEKGDGKAVKATNYNISVRFQIRFREHHRTWIVECPALGVVTQGKTKQSAIKSLRDAIELWFESCIARNVLHEALTECGFDRTKNEHAPGPVDTVNIAIQQSRTTPALDALPKATFSVSSSKQKTYGFIDGMIPAYIASQQLGEMSLARH